MSPELIESMISCGGWPSIVHPTDCAVPRISFTVPAKVLASERGRMIRAMLKISSRGMFPVCLMFFSFFRSRGGSERNGLAVLIRESWKWKYDVPLRARMTKEDAEGTTATVACRFWMVSWTVIRSPFQSPVALAISSPTFLGAYERWWRHCKQRSRSPGKTYQTQGTDFGSKRSTRCDFTTSGS